uniref:ARF7EP_C domain-containing protein n=1 Tax=Glossina brevipalpis TaxID=37001 RepID=A0A1A9WVU2_9MUSC
MRRRILFKRHLRERPCKRKLQEQCDELKFRGDSKSNPKERSHQRPYDEYGQIRHNGLDVCDCMNEDCPGCWFECEKCGSTKCGLECRVNQEEFIQSKSLQKYLNKYFCSSSACQAYIPLTDLTMPQLCTMEQRRSMINDQYICSVNDFRV